MNEGSFIVYIVDDDEDDVEILSEAFETMSLTSSVKCFTSSAKLLSKLKTLQLAELPDIIILDHYLALLHGTDLMEIIRNERTYDTIALAVYSSAIQPGKILNMLQKGVDVCMEKGNTTKQTNDHVKTFCEAVEKKKMLSARTKQMP